MGQRALASKAGCEPLPCAIGVQTEDKQKLLVCILWQLHFAAHSTHWIFTHEYRCNHSCWLLVSGVLKENAEQIGHAVRHAGLRPALPMMQQAVDTFFHLCLPRRHEVCSHISARLWILDGFCQLGLCVCARVRLALYGLNCNCSGLRVKFHAKAIMKLVFSFSRIAKCLG